MIELFGKAVNDLKVWFDVILYWAADTSSSCLFEIEVLNLCIGVIGRLVEN